MLLASMFISFVVKTDQWYNTINMKIFPTDNNTNATLYFLYC